MYVRTFVKPSAAICSRRSLMTTLFVPPTLMPRSSATYSMCSSPCYGDPSPRQPDTRVGPRLASGCSRTLTRQSARGPSNPHVNPLMRAWAALPTLHIAGLRAIVRVNTRNSGFTCEQRTTARHWCAQNADHFATSSPLSAFFTEVVCNVGTTPPRTAATPPPIGGNDAIQGSDTPTTRRKKASNAVKSPPPPAWRTPGARRARPQCP